MGFLLGAYGKITAGLKKGRIQFKLLRIQRKLERSSKQIGDMEKKIENDRKTNENAIDAKYNLGVTLAQTAAENYAQLQDPDVWLKGKTGQQLTGEESAKYTNMLNIYNQYMTQTKAALEQQRSFEKERLEEYITYLKDTQLEPLRREEEALKLEKQTLDTQLAIAGQDEEACEKMEQDGLKTFKPNYVPGGGGG